MDKPLVSVIMPAYNADKFIREAIQSVLDQDHTNFELLIVNDGSTDQTKEIIHSFSGSRIQYFEQKNQGVSTARNVGLDNMRGDYFCFLDADDQFTVTSISSRLAVFQNDEQICFVDGAVDGIDDRGKNLGRIFTPSFRGYPLEKLLRIRDDCFFGPSWMIKKEKGRRYHFESDMKYCEDLFFYISTAEDRLYSFTENIILLYTKHDSSAMNNMKALSEGYLLFLKRLIEHFPNRNMLKTKLRIGRILFLSWLFDAKNPMNAFRALIKTLMT